MGVLAWRRKILGFQHSVLTKGFYAIRYIHIVEGYDDLTLMSHRIRCLIKAVKHRGGACKKLPFTTDMIRRVRKQFLVDMPEEAPRRLAQVWCGLLIAFFYCLRISELQALTVDDVAIAHNEKGSMLSVSIRGSETDQEQVGVTRTPRENNTDVFPAKAMIA